MLKIENVDIYGWEAVIRSCRNPLNSWVKSDSAFQHGDDYLTINDDAADSEFIAEQIASGRLYDRAFIGPNDYKLMQNLCKGGSEESKWRRFVHVTCDITAPLYFYKQLDVYRVGVEKNSCSTMHKIQAKQFTFDDFSHEHLIYFPRDGSDIDLEDQDVKDAYCSVHVSSTDAVFSPEGALELTINMLNRARYLFLKTKDKRYWWQMIQLLPSSYNQRRTYEFNYESLANIYRQRKNHKLDCWRDFCSFIEHLPYSEFITLEAPN